MSRKGFFGVLFGATGMSLCAASIKKKDSNVCNSDVKVYLTITSNGKNALILNPNGNLGLGTNCPPNYRLYIK